MPFFGLAESLANLGKINTEDFSKTPIYATFTDYDELERSVIY